MGRLLGVGSLRKQAPNQGGFESHGLHFNSAMQRFKDTRGWKVCSEIGHTHSLQEETEAKGRARLVQI